MSLTGKVAVSKLLQGKINGLDVIYTDTYEIAVRNGFEGTEAEWVAMLQAKEVLVAEYGVTTFAELEEAYNAGRVVFCRYGNKCVSMSERVEGESMSFRYMDSDDSVTYFCLKSNKWNMNKGKHPVAHASRHAADGDDPITPESIGAASEDYVSALQDDISALREIIDDLKNRLTALESGGSMISFTLDGYGTFNAPNGMTWGEFVSSEYNPTSINEECCGEEYPYSQFYIEVNGATDGESVVYTESCCGPPAGYLFTDSSCDYEFLVSSGDTIDAGKTYYLGY